MTPRPASWLGMPSAEQAPAASPTASSDLTAPPAERPVASVTLQSTARETVLSAHVMTIVRMGLPATAALATASMQCVRVMINNASFTLETVRIIILLGNTF